MARIVPYEINYKTVISLSGIAEVLLWTASTLAVCIIGVDKFYSNPNKEQWLTWLNSAICLPKIEKAWVAISHSCFFTYAIIW